MHPNPITRTPIRRKNKNIIEYPEGMPGKDRSRDWSDMPTNQGTPKVASNNQKLGSFQRQREKREKPLQP